VTYFNQEVTEIPFLCSNASQRLVMASFLSDSQATRPALKINTSQATIIIGPNAISTTSTWQSSGTSVGPGIYHLVLTQSECSSQGGPGYVMLYTSTLTTGPQYHKLYFPRVDSYNTTNYGLVGLSAVTLAPGTHSGATVQGLSNYANISNVTLHAGTHSDVTIKGLSNYANISNVTLHAGTHSSVTIQGVTRVNSGVTLNADTHSGATVQGISNYANHSNVTLHAGVHSGASVEIKTGGIQASSFGAGAVDAVALATDAGQELADRLITRNIEGGSDTGRIVRDVFSVLRNKVGIEDSRLTVYRTDDSTSAWTADVTTGTQSVSGVDPAGP
jgi:hypothetical protein